MRHRRLREKLVWGTPSFWMNVFPLYFGRHKGFFGERGIDLKIEYFYGGPELAAAVQEGRIQIGTMGVPPFSKAFSGGLPARIVGSAIIQRLDHYLVAHPKIEKPANLKGKRIGILSLGSCDHYFVRRILEKESMDPDGDVQLVPLGRSYGDLEPIVSKKVDAAFLVEPKVTLGESLDAVRIVARVGDYFPRYQWSVIFARDDFIQKKSDLIKKLLEAYRTSCRAIREKPEESVGYGGMLFKIRKELFWKALQRDLANWEIEARIDRQGLENALRIQQEIDAVRRDLRAEEMVHPM